MIDGLAGHSEWHARASDGMPQTRSSSRVSTMRCKGTPKQAPAPLDLLDSWRWRPRPASLGSLNAAYTPELGRETR